MDWTRARNEAYHGTLLSYVKSSLPQDQWGSVVDQNGSGLMSCAIQFRDIAALRFFIDIGMNVNHEKEGGFTPICLAACLGLVEELKILIDAGANAAHVSKDGFTPLSMVNFEIKNRIANNSKPRPGDRLIGSLEELKECRQLLLDRIQKQ